MLSRGQERQRRYRLVDFNSVSKCLHPLSALTVSHVAVSLNITANPKSVKCSNCDGHHIDLLRFVLSSMKVEQDLKKALELQAAEEEHASRVRLPPNQRTLTQWLHGRDQSNDK